MEEQLKPISQTNKPEEKISNISLPDLKNLDDIITKLPEWSIEPPLEINRGNE